MDIERPFFSYRTGNSDNPYEVLTPEQLEELKTMVLVREPDRLDELPPQYSVITSDDLDFTPSEQDGYIDDTGYFHGGSKAEGGQAVALLEDDGTISISFRGTNDLDDLSSIMQFSDRSYIYGFDAWLSSVAKFASENNYEIEYVTGKSLGGAATNMLRDESDQIADGAYSDAIYFAVASPVVAYDEVNLINFGYYNDYAFQSYEKFFGTQRPEFESTTENNVYYNGEFADKNWNGFLDFSSHSYNAFANGVNAINNSVFYDEFEHNSFIVLAETTKTISVDLALERVNPIQDWSYVLSTNDLDHKVIGSKLFDNIEMGNGDDRIFGYFGDDVIYGGGGDDYINGGADEDYIEGGAGDDDLRGGYGEDYIFGGSGQNTIRGGEGNDQIFGGDGDDIIMAGSDQDYIIGGAGADKIFGQRDRDFINGGTGNDSLFGGSEDDELYGEDGNDRLFGGLEDDLLYGSIGDDLLYAGKGNDYLSGDEGEDILRGAHGDDKIYGGDGDDLLYGGKGDDVLFSDAGNDVMTGGRGADHFHIDAAGTDVITDFNLNEDRLILSVRDPGDPGAPSAFDIGARAFTNADNNLEFSFKDGSTLILNGTTVEELEALAEEEGQDNWEDLIFIQPYD